MFKSRVGDISAKQKQKTKIFATNPKQELDFAPTFSNLLHHWVILTLGVLISVCYFNFALKLELFKSSNLNK